MDPSRDPHVPAAQPVGTQEQQLPDAVQAAAGDVSVRRVRELERQLEYERDANKTRLREVAEHLTGLRERMEEMRAITEERRKLRRQVNELEQRVASVEDERDRLAEQVAGGVGPSGVPQPGTDAAARLASLEQACAAQEAELVAARAQVTQLEGELVRAREEHALTEQQRVAAKAELEAARNQLAEALSALEHAYESAQGAVPVLPEELQWEDEDGPRSGAMDGLTAGIALPLRTGEMTDFEELPVYDGQEEPAAIVPEELNTVELSGVELESAIRARRPQPAPARGRRGDPDKGGRGRREGAAAPAAANALHTTTGGAAPSAAALARMAARKRFPDISGLRFERHVAGGEDVSRFEAREVSSRRPVTVRVICGDHAGVDELGIDTLLLARHPNLVSALEFGVTPLGPYLVFERASGETLEEWIGRVGPVPEHVALGVALQATRGLRKAAFHDCVHGELSPRSIVIESTGRVRVDGVGLHRLYAKSKDGPRAPGYAAPEIVRGSGEPSAAADMYSLAALLFFLVTGKPPFDGDLEQVRKRQRTATFPDPRQRGAEVGDGFVALLLGCAATDPATRPSAWEAVLAELERLVTSAETEPSVLIPRTGFARIVAEHPIAVAVAACVPLVAIGLGLKLLLG